MVLGLKGRFCQPRPKAWEKGRPPHVRPEGPVRPGVRANGPFRPGDCRSCFALRSPQATKKTQMKKPRLKHINRRLTAEERARHAQIIAAALKDIPPKHAGRKPSPPGIPAKIRQAREALGLTWYALAKAAGIPNQATIRDIEQGNDVKFSNLRAVADALGLKLELVEKVA
jgi:hypothetical protein